MEVQGCITGKLVESSDNMIKGKLDVKSTDLILEDRGLQDMGPVQKFIDNECINKMIPYTPMLSGFLSNNAPRIGTVIGSGLLEYNSPYARYQYYGKLMVSSITGSAWASKGEKKILTDRDLVHSKHEHPLAGAFWFERMKADKKEVILKGAQQIANRGK